ncbi:3-hydroxyisobutyrate dehydrogenase [Leptospirillum ferriphilum]|jgi:3-hydroxyisobutyrate dehydrogenase|uniref:3-hydroxyisobutyrate dehydrogenase n=1 Tax=Leptospirillum ferriphilum TaxID=178606 RepID=A0A094W8F9_9BACT|nr:NAD(P)-dependent oxidoreductase [Leptospirillum ferriphilum]KGA92770.1 3-hydroxyisobutyrate dehydrogenase [Leptospirillum ferriphilum]
MAETMIGWAGIGSMGVRMVRRLLDNGIPVTGYNRTSGRLPSHPLFHAAHTPADIAEKSDLIFLMVTDGSASRALLEGPDGIARGLCPGSLVINMSTIAPEEAQEEALFLLSKGAGYLDIPVSGSLVPAEKGELLLLAGGDGAALERARSILLHFGKKILHFGPTGSGMKAKLVINLLLASHVESLVQTVLVGESLGLDGHQVLGMILDSPLATPFYRIKRTNIEKRSYDKAFSARLMAKDLDLLSLTLLRNRTPASLPFELGRHFRELVESGRGEEDVSALYEYFRDRILPK